MADAATATSGAEAITPDAQPDRTLYSVSGLHKTVFCFIFLLLLPFYVSLPFMLAQRLQHGLLGASIELLVMGTFFSILMFLVLIELIFALRAQVELGETTVKMTLPSGRGPTPMLRYKTHVVPYADIHAIETRREIYGGAMVPVLLKGARIIKKNGESIALGYVSEANVDPAFPYPEIAKQIADRARLPLIDRGNVRRSFRAKFFGVKQTNVKDVDTVSEAEIEVLNRSHRNVVFGLVGVLALLIVIGIIEDFAAGTPVGHTYGFFSDGGSATQPAKPTTAKPKSN